MSGGVRPLIKINRQTFAFVGAATELHGKASADDGPNTVLYRSVKGERQRRVSASKSCDKSSQRDYDSRLIHKFRYQSITSINKSFPFRLISPFKP